MIKKPLAILLAVMLLSLCACTGTDSSAPAISSGSAASAAETDEVQYGYQLKAGEPIEVYDVTFEKMVTITIDPASTRNGAANLRSDIYFDNCAFQGGVTIVGDYHAMVSFGAGCSFGDGSVVTRQETVSGATKDVVLEDNIVKVFASCAGVAVKTEAATGVLTDGPDVVVNGTAYSKSALAPDTDFLGIYTLYEEDEMTCLKLAISEDDSVEFLE